MRHFSVKNILLVLAAFYCIADINFRSWGLSDEGMTLTIARAIGDGRQPYRDLITGLSPAVFYYLAAVFKLFGTSFIWARFWSACFPKIMITWIVYKMAGMQVKEEMAAVSAAFCALALGTPTFTGPLVIWPTPLAALGATAAQYLFMKKKMAWAGLACGMTFLFRHDVGLYVFGPSRVVFHMPA